MGKTTEQIDRGGWTLEELDTAVAAIPQLAILRDLHELVPRLIKEPRDPDLTDPYDALIALSECLWDRVQREIRTKPIKRDRLRLKLIADGLNPGSNPLPDWDPREQFLDHRINCYKAVYSAIHRIGNEAKLRAAHCGHDSQGIDVVNALLEVIETLFSWRENCTDYLHNFLNDTANPALERLYYFARKVRKAECPSAIQQEWTEDYLSAAVIAERLNKDPESVRKKLERLAKKHDCAIENEGRKVHEPKWLYRVKDVLPFVR